MISCCYLENPCRYTNGLNTADTTAGTIPSSMKEGMNQIIIGGTLRTPTARVWISVPLIMLRQRH
jgi:hypothetical protein